MQNLSPSDGGKRPDQPKKYPSSYGPPLLNNFYKTFPSGHKIFTEATACSLLEDIAATQPIGQDTAKTQKLDHIQIKNAMLPEKVTGGDATVDQDDHTRSDSATSYQKEGPKSVS